MKKIECVIMDWAGTAVDYGCFAPVAAFLKAFGEVGSNHGRSTPPYGNGKNRPYP